MIVCAESFVEPPKFISKVNSYNIEAKFEAMPTHISYFIDGCFINSTYKSSYSVDYMKPEFMMWRQSITLMLRGEGGIHFQGMYR